MAHPVGLGPGWAVLLGMVSIGVGLWPRVDAGPGAPCEGLMVGLCDLGALLSKGGRHWSGLLTCHSPVRCRSAVARGGRGPTRGGSGRPGDRPTNTSRVKAATPWSIGAAASGRSNGVTWWWRGMCRARKSHWRN